MIKEYIGSLGNRHNLIKYTLANGVEVTLNGQEAEELFNEFKFYINKINALSYENQDLLSSVQFLENEVEVLETRLEKYQEIAKTFKSFQEQLDKVKC